MDHRKYPVSVVPYPIDKARSLNLNKVSTSGNDLQDDSAEWDAKWLRPNLSASSTPAPRVTEPVTPQQRAWDAKWLRRNLNLSPVPSPKVENTGPLQPQKIEPEKLMETPKESIFLRVLHWLFPDVNQRRAKRYPTPGLVAYYWTGGTSYSYQVGDMSATGLFLLTKEKWAPGTLIQMTLQQREGPTASNNYLCVLSEVVRWGDNGTGCNFVLSDFENVGDLGMLPSEAIDRKSVERFLQRICIPGRA